MKNIKKTIQCKTVITLLLFIGALNVCSSQETSKRVKYELSYGVNLNDVYNHVNDINFQKRISPVLIGFSLNKKLSNNTQIYLELEYSRKGPKNHVIDYFTISPMFGRDIINDHFRVVAGPYLSILNKYKINGIVSNHDELKQIDFGVQLGIAKKIQVKKRIFYIASQFELGLYEYSFSKHQVLQFKITYEI